MSWSAAYKYGNSSSSSIASSLRSRSSGRSPASSRRLNMDLAGGSLSSATLSSIKDDTSLDFTLNSELSKFEADQAILPNPEYNNKRRTIVLQRDTHEESFGFAIQSYVFKRCNSGATERITYVDYVRDGSAAAKSGIRKGDVIVAVNGVSVVCESHSSLVQLMSAQLKMRLVLLFQNIARIIQLSARSLQLQYLLKEKQRMVDILDQEERRLLAGSKHALMGGSSSASTSGSSLPGFGTYGATGSNVSDSGIDSSEHQHHPDDPAHADADTSTSDISMNDISMSEGPCDPLGVGLTHVIRVDSRSSLAAQVTRL